MALSKHITHNGPWSGFLYFNLTFSHPEDTPILWTINSTVLWSAPKQQTLCRTIHAYRNIHKKLISTDLVYIMWVDFL